MQEDMLLKQGPASSAAAGEDQRGWESLDEGLLPLIAYRLQETYQRSLGSARLACRQWAAELVQGCTRLKVKGKGPPDWEHRFCGLKELVWLAPENVGQSLPATLRSLRLRRCRDEDLLMLRGLTDLVSLDLSQCRRTQTTGITGLEELELVPNLTSLDLSECDGIMDVDLEELGHISALASLNLSRTNITDEGLKHLKHMTNITSLDLSDCCDISDEGLKHLKHMTNITSLSLESRNLSLMITDEGLKELKNFSFLASLSLERNERITDEGMKELKEMPCLTSLNLRKCLNLTNEGLEELQYMSNLTSLDLGECEISDAGVRHLQHMPNLASLSLGVEAGLDYKYTGYHIGVTDEGLKDLKHMHLTKLDLTGCAEITDEGLKHLRHMSNLTTLNLKYCHITDVGLRVLRRHMSSLTSLNLFFPGRREGITDDGLEHISHISTLTSLTLAGYDEITDFGLKKLGGNLGSLTSLNLSHSNFITYLCLKEIGQMSRLTSLNLIVTVLYQYQYLVTIHIVGPEAF